jgi:hypothetical protein
MEHLQQIIRIRGLMSNTPAEVKLSNKTGAGTGDSQTQKVSPESSEFDAAVADV